MIAEADLSRPAFRIGQVFAQSLRLLTSRLALYFILALIVLSPRLVLNFAVNGQHNVAWLGFAQQAIEMTFGQFLTAVITYGVFQHLRGQPASIGACFRFGFQRLPALIGVVLITSWIIGLYALLLIVPGIMKATALWLIVPICVIEGLGGSDCRQRSDDLTKGYRWHIFGMMLLTFVLIVLWSFTLNMIYADYDSDKVAMPALYVIADYVGDAVVAVISSVLVTVSYFELRRAKDGLDVGDIAAIFD